MHTSFETAPSSSAESSHDKSHSTPSQNFNDHDNSLLPSSSAPSPSSSSFTSSPRVANSHRFPRAAKKRVHPASSADAFESRAEEPQYNSEPHEEKKCWIQCVDCRKKFSIPSAFSFENFPSIWHCSDATWDLSLGKDCKVRAEQMQLDEEDAPIITPPTKRRRQGERSNNSDRKVVDRAPEPLLRGRLSERLQMKVLLQLGTLCEAETKRKLQEANSLSKSEFITIQENAFECRSAVCFHCQKRCSHSKLSLKLKMSDLGLAERSHSFDDVSIDAVWKELDHEPSEDCVTVLGHLVHKKCLKKLQDEKLILPLNSLNAGGDSDVDIFANDTRDAAFREDLFCFRKLLKNPGLKMNTKYFERKYVQAANGRKRVLVLEQDPDAIGLDLKKSSTKTEILLADYYKYQGSFCEKYAARRAMYRERVFEGLRAENRSADMQNQDNSSWSTGDAAASNISSSRNEAKRTGIFFSKTRKFCSHLDLLPETKWRRQHRELQKLPPWLYCQTSEDLLRYCRRQIPGMTSPQMYIKVPGVWTAAHEENNQFRSVNVNHGPGPCEWAGIAAIHTPRLRQLVLESHNIDIYKEEGRWVPPLDYLIKHKIPVITGLQNESDLILVGIGCIHWVYSSGQATCTAWNVGELSYKMFDAAFRRRDENLKIGFPSLVPMYTLAYDVLTDALRSKERSSSSIVSTTSSSSSLNNERSSYDFSDLSQEVLQLLCSRLSEAAGSILSNIALLQTFLQDVPIYPEPEDESWCPLHCANPACMEELFSVYVSRGINKMTNGSKSDTQDEASIMNEYECFCISCAKAMHNSSGDLTCGDVYTVTPFQRHTAEKVHRLISSLQRKLAMVRKCTLKSL